MSAEIRALAADYPTEVPGEDFEYLISLLTSKGTSFDRLKAAKVAYDVAGYLMGKFFTVASVESVAKPKKVSKKAIAEALKSLKGGGNVASVKVFPAWLIPVLLNLAQQWLANQK